MINGRKFSFSMCSCQGFSFLELMIVVSITGVVMMTSADLIRYQSSNVSIRFKNAVYSPG